MPEQLIYFTLLCFTLNQIVYKKKGQFDFKSMKGKGDEKD